MKQLTITKLIKDCADCPYCNMWGGYCSLYKRSLPEFEVINNEHNEFDADTLDDLVKDLVSYEIPSWCKLDELEEYKDHSVYLVSCAVNGDKECMGVSCVFAYDTKILPNRRIEFACKRFPCIQKLIRS
jgi:hypothetical protein